MFVFDEKSQFLIENVQFLLEKFITTGLKMLKNLNITFFALNDPFPYPSMEVIRALKFITTYFHNENLVFKTEILPNLKYFWEIWRCQLPFTRDPSLFMAENFWIVPDFGWF